jgi:CheY-like chemotaxis protein
VDRNLTILIAEDDEDYQEILKRALRDIGLKNPVRILPNGDEIIEYLKGAGQYSDRSANPYPSVLFLDVKMPGTNGFDILRWLRQHPDYLVMPTMIFSSSNLERDIRLAYELGANAYFIKPARFEDLKAMLQTAHDFWALCAKVPVGKRGE